MLILNKIIGSGYTRNCYKHPYDKNLCVKIELKPDANSYELHVYDLVKSLIPGQIAKIYSTVIETDKGPGITSQLIRDETDENISPNFHEYKLSGDFKQIEASLNRIIKRVIAVSGEKVVIDYNSDRVYVCDADKEPGEKDRISESYLKQADMTDPEAFFSEEHFDAESGRYIYTVPVGYVFVMGDNRNSSTDSRAIGLIDLNDVEGKAFFRFASPKGKKLGLVK